MEKFAYTIIFNANRIFNVACALLARSNPQKIAVLDRDVDKMLAGLKQKSGDVLIMFDDYSAEDVSKIKLAGFNRIFVFGKTTKYGELVETFYLDRLYDYLPISNGTFQIFFMEKIVCFEFPQYKSKLHNEDYPVNHVAGVHLVNGLLLNNRKFDEATIELFKVHPMKIYDAEAAISLAGKSWLSAAESIARERVQIHARTIEIGNIAVGAVYCSDVIRMTREMASRYLDELRAESDNMKETTPQIKETAPEIKKELNESHENSELKEIKLENPPVTTQETAPVRAPELVTPVTSKPRARELYLLFYSAIASPNNENKKSIDGYRCELLAGAQDMKHSADLIKAARAAITEKINVYMISESPGNLEFWATAEDFRKLVTYL